MSLAAQAVPEQMQAKDCADFDPRLPLVDDAAVAVGASTSRRAMQSGCESMLSASTIAEFDELIAQNTVM